MKTILGVLTIAGGHLLAGKRIRGYLYLIALVLLPIVCWFVQGLWIIYAPDRRAVAPDVAGWFFWIALIIIWLSSIGLLVRDRGALPSAAALPTWAPRILEVAGVSVAALAAIGFSVLSIGVVPLLPQRSDGLGNDRPSVRGQELPNRQGSVQFLGILYIQGRPAANRKLLFLFESGYISRGIVTDDAGRFAYTLPPGRWTLMGPHLPGDPGDISVSIEPPIQRPDLSFDVSEGPISERYTLTIRAN